MSQLEKIKLLVREIQNLFFIKKYNLIIAETQKAIKLYPNYSIFYNLLGLALTQLGKFEDAKLVLNKGYEINPNDLAIINNLANVYKNIFNFKEAERLYNLSISKKENYFNAYVNYGNLKRDLNKFEEAIKLYEKALNINEKVPEIYYSLAMAYQSLGKFEISEKYANKAIKENPNTTKADLLISRSKKYKIDDSHLNSMIKKDLQNDLDISQKIDLSFALAKAHEDIGEIDKSVEYLEKGNKLKRTVINFDLNFEEKKFRNIEKIFIDIFKNKYSKSNFKNKKIIFIVGMPRSGTTLIEQIISAHSEVNGCGELPYLSKIINEEFTDNKDLSLTKIKEIINNPDKLSIISKRYYTFIDNYEISSKCITDKAPLNFIWIGFIKILFPDAKIIHCKRNAEDNCLSLYKNVFDGTLNFCYSQQELGSYYNLYLKLMNFWKDHSSESFFDVKYEDLIKNTKDETKKMLNYCGLEWEESCLDFSKNKTPIKTASVGQARNKIYSSSVKSSLKYKKHLRKLFSLI